MPTLEELKAKISLAPDTLENADLSKESDFEAMCFAAERGYVHTFSTMLRLLHPERLRNLIFRDNYLVFLKAANRGQAEILRLIFALFDNPQFASLDNPQNRDVLYSLIKHSNETAVKNGHYNVLLYNIGEIRKCGEKRQIKMIRNYGYQILHNAGSAKDETIKILLNLIPAKLHREAISIILSKAIIEQDHDTLNPLLEVSIENKVFSEINSTDNELVVAINEVLLVTPENQHSKIIGFALALALQIENYEMIWFALENSSNKTAAVQTLLSLTPEELHRTTINALLSKAIIEQDYDILDPLLTVSIENKVFSEINSTDDELVVAIKEALSVTPENQRGEIIRFALALALRIKNPEMIWFALNNSSQKTETAKTCAYGLLQLCENNDERAVVLERLLALTLPNQIQAELTLSENRRNKILQSYQEEKQKTEERRIGFLESLPDSVSSEEKPKLNLPENHREIIDTLFRATWAKADFEMLEFLSEKIPQSQLSEASNFVIEQMRKAQEEAKHAEGFRDETTTPPSSTEVLFTRRLNGDCLSCQLG